jgi:hypothetical protein
MKPLARWQSRSHMRRRLTLLLAAAAPFVLAGCGKGKY